MGVRVCVRASMVLCLVGTIQLYSDHFQTSHVSCIHQHNKSTIIAV